MNRRRRPAKITVRVKEWTARLANVFGERIGRRTSESALSERMGQSRGFVNKVKAHARGGRMADLLHSLEASGDEMPTDLLHQAFEQVPVDAVAVLACSRERQSGLKPNPFLEGFGPRLRALVELGLTPGKWRSQRETLRAFEKLRFNDRELSAAKLEFFVGAAMTLLEKLGSRPEAAFADLACALGSLAVAYRIGGRRDDALDILLLAHPLAILSEDPFAEGAWYQKSAYLLVDFGRYDRAYEFIQEAAMRFFAAGNPAKQVEAQVDLGYVLSHVGRGEEVLKVLRRALPLIPTEDRTTIFSVHQLRAIAFRDLGRYGEAWTALNEAAEFADHATLSFTYLQWSRARLSVETGNLPGAIRAFQETPDLYRNESATEVAELAFDHAAQLIGQNRHQELKELTEGASIWAAEIVGARRLREILEDFAASHDLRNLDEAFLQELRKRLPAKVKAKPSYRRRKPQPPGDTVLPGSSSVGDLIHPPNEDCSSGSSASTEPSRTFPSKPLLSPTDPQ